MDLIRAKELFIREVQRAGSDEFDINSFFANGMYELMFPNFMTRFGFENGMDPELLEYWRTFDKGLIKEAHHTGDRKAQYLSYTPCGAKNTVEKKYPLLVVMHGGGNSMDEVESFGYLSIAAREEIIIAAPDFLESEHVMDIIKEVCDKYPVDRSRIYASGFSYGGGMASRLVVKYPHIFAAAAIGGHLYYGECTPPEWIENAVKWQIPMQNFTGNADFTYLIPFNKDQKYEPPTDLPEYLELGFDIVSYTAHNKLNGLDMWRRISGCEVRPRCGETCSADYPIDPVELTLGTYFEDSEIRTIDGKPHLIGRQFDKNGNCTFCCITVPNGPHVQIPSFARLNWEFLKHFSRHPASGKIIWQA